HAVDPHTSLTRQKGFKVDDFYAARSRTIPPLPWSNIAPPFSGRDSRLLEHQVRNHKNVMSHD
ncbi:hypothetical protein OSJ57_23645, partial [Sphingomonas sp. HH69]